LPFLRGRGVRSRRPAMPRLPCLFIGFAVAALALLTPPSVRAQSRTFYLDRAQLSGAPDDGFMVWRPYVWEKTRFYGMAALGYAHRPLRDTTVSDDAITARNVDDPVDGQILMYLLAGTQIGERASINVQLPITLYQFLGDDPQRFGVGAGGLSD